jgi:hypothetical protein
MRSLSSHENHADIAFARLVDGIRKTFAKSFVEIIVRRIGKHDVANALVAIESNRFHN